MARITNRRTALVREAWTDVGDVGVGRRSDLRIFVTLSQICMSYACRQSVLEMSPR